MPLAVPHGSHPDGDPFEEADRLAHENSVLGRLEAKAQREEAERERLANGGAQPGPAEPSPALSGRGQRNSTSIYKRPPSGPPKPQPEVVTLADSSDDDEQPQRASKSPARQTGSVSKPASIEQAKVDDSPSTPSRASRPRSTSASIQQQLLGGGGSTGAAAAVQASSPTVASPEPEGMDVSLADMSGDLSALSSPPNSPSAGEPTSPAPDADDGHDSDHDSTQGMDVDQDKDDQPPKDATAAGDGAGTKRPRSSTPSPKPKPPPRTIRLQINLPFPVTIVPEYSVADLALEAGYGDEASQDGSGSGSEDSGTEAEDGAVKKSSKGKEKTGTEDTADESKQAEAKMDGVEGSAAAPGEGDASKPDGDAEPPKKKRKRGQNKVLGRFGGYDSADSFVDDSEVQLYEPQYYHRPVREGYFVQSGLVEAMSNKPGRGRTVGSKNKPKFDQDGNPIPATRKSKGDAASGDASASTSKAKPGSKPRKSLGVDPDLSVPTGPPLPMVSSIPAFGNGAPPAHAASASAMPAPKKKREGGHSVEMLQQFEMLRAEVNKADFTIKSKFPQHLRPIIVKVALRALELGEYDDEFFAELPRILPYNNFTLRKLTKREIFPERIKLIEATQEQHLQTIRDGIVEQMPKCKADHVAAMAAWEKEKLQKEAAKAVAGESAPKPSGLDVTMAPPPPIAAVKDSAVPGTDDAAATGSPAPGAEDADSEPKEPPFKFKFTESMKMSLYYLLTSEDERIALIAEKAELEKTTEKLPTSLIARKAIYAKVNSLFEEGTMTTNQLSREMSLIKKKVEKHLGTDADK